MKSISLTGLLLFLYCLNGIRGFMDLGTFEEKIAKICYRRRDDRNEELPNGQIVPIPNTIEAFISLVEKIENMQQPRWKMEELVKTLLTSFRYDDLVYRPRINSFESRINEQTFIFDIIKQIFGQPAKSAQALPENSLTDDEKCALYFMISHTVNDTKREGDETVTDKNLKQVVKYPREQGVVSLESNQGHAFALGKVLLGLYAGFQGNSKTNALAIWNGLKPNQESSSKEVLQAIEIDLIYSVTFGDLIALSTFQEQKEDGQSSSDIFLPNGFWNEADCPTSYYLTHGKEYELLNPLIHTTYSSIRGAIDGYVLGKVIQKIARNYKDIRLSQVLRSYYTHHALSDGEKIEVTWCHRQPHFKTLLNEIKNEAINYTLLCSALKGTPITQTNLIGESVGNILKRIEALETEIIVQFERESSVCGNANPKQCETDSSIFAVTDYKLIDSLEQQREIIGNLTSGFQLSLYGSSSSVYTNLKPYGGGYGLDTVVNSTSYPGCSACALKYYEPRQATSDSEIDVLRNLNRTLGTYSKEKEEEKSIPAKVVLYFNNGQPRDDRQLKEALWELKYYHPDIKVLAFGRKEYLKYFVNDENKDIFTLGLTSPEFFTKIKDRICRIPAQFQYDECYKRDVDESSRKVEGFITPNNVQYWTMHPKYFLKSYHIKLTFKTEQGQIKVCFSRNYDEIAGQKEPRGDCKDTATTSTSNSGGSGNSVNFWVKNPCHRYNVYNCPPFYFYIEGKTKQTTFTNIETPCTDVRCKTPDQIPFEFIHEGISCNKGVMLSAFPALFYSIMTFITWIILSTK